MITNIDICVKPLWKVKGFFNPTSWKVSDVHIVRKTRVLSSVSVSVSVSVCCVLLCCCGARGARGCGGGGGRRRGGRETNRTIWAKVSLEIT